MNENKKKMITLELSEDIIFWLKQKREREGIFIKKTIEDILREGMEKEKNEK